MLLFCLLEKQAMFISPVPCSRRGCARNRMGPSRSDHESKCTGKAETNKHYLGNTYGIFGDHWKGIPLWRLDSQAIRQRFGTCPTCLFAGRLILAYRMNRMRNQVEIVRGWIKPEEWANLKANKRYFPARSKRPCRIYTPIKRKDVSTVLLAFPKSLKIEIAPS